MSQNFENNTLSYPVFEYHEELQVRNKEPNVT